MKHKRHKRPYTTLDSIISLMNGAFLNIWGLLQMEEMNGLRPKPKLLAYENIIL